MILVEGVRENISLSFTSSSTGTDVLLNWNQGDRSGKTILN